MKKRITAVLLLMLVLAMLITGCRPPSNQSRGDGGTQAAPQSSTAPQNNSTPQGDIDADIDIEEIERFLDELEDDFAEADEILGQFR